MKALHATSRKSLKVAIVHDWLTARGGAEKVVLAMHELFPEAPIYTSAFVPEVLPEFAELDVRTTFINRIPVLRRKHKLAFLLRMIAFYHLDLSEYDLVISSTTAEAKGVKTKRGSGTKPNLPKHAPAALHICYCNTPTRYYWSGYEEYLARPGFGWLNPLVRIALRILIKPLRWLDLRMAARPDVYIGNSSAVTERIKRYYHREALTLFPSVETDRFQAGSAKNRHGLLIAGRQVPYKRVDLAIAACNQLELPLTVVGGGSEHDKLVAMAGPTIRFVSANDAELAKLYETTGALLYPAEEDAGIVPVEAMAAGTPVIAYAKGGSLDTVIDGKTGILFDEQSVDGLVAAIKRWQKTAWDHQAIHRHALQFDKKQFQKQLQDIVNEQLNEFKQQSTEISNGK